MLPDAAVISAKGGQKENLPPQTETSSFRASEGVTGFRMGQVSAGNSARALLPCCRLGLALRYAYVACIAVYSTCLCCLYDTLGFGCRCPRDYVEDTGASVPPVSYKQGRDEGDSSTCCQVFSLWPMKSGRGTTC